MVLPRIYMYSANTDPSSNQEKAFALIDKGRKLFIDAENDTDRENGFKIFLNGIDMIMFCFKRINQKPNFIKLSIFFFLFRAKERRYKTSS